RARPRSKRSPSAILPGVRLVPCSAGRGAHGHGGRLLPALDVLDRLGGDLADAIEQALLEPLGARAREGRDKDVVDPVVLDRVAHRGERLRAHRLAGRVDFVAVKLREGACEPRADLLAADVPGPRADERVAMRTLL